jgi:anoctamin-10
LRLSTRFVTDDDIDMIRNYYGEQVAFYYAWQAFYTRATVYPAVYGLLVFILQRCPFVSNEIVKVLQFFYAIFMIMFASLFEEFWKRKQFFWSIKWGVINLENLDIKRSEFRGELK